MSLWVPNVTIRRPTVVRRGKAMKTALWWMHWTDAAGVRHKETTGTADKTAARMVAQAKAAELIAGVVDPTVAHREMTWEQCANEFIRQKRSALAADTIALYESVAGIFAKACGNLPVQQISNQTIGGYISERRKTVGAQTMNKDLRHIRSTLRWARKQGFIKEAPQIDFLRTDKKQPVCLDRSVYHDLLRAIANPHAHKLCRFASPAWWEVFVRLAHGLGARRGELLGVRWEHVRWTTGEVFVSFSTSKGRRGPNRPRLARPPGRSTGVATQEQASRGRPSPPVAPRPEAVLRGVGADHRGCRSYRCRSQELPLDGGQRVTDGGYSDHPGQGLAGA